ncbi:hypothetical protein ACFV4F_35920 [Kitasatospora sp. NPDC059722]|uniref:hypothetical protein n=1 Tax=Kitasatospora sp. NPDC059722 TaxID=3346925 RepID=UPI0036C05639
MNTPTDHTNDYARALRTLAHDVRSAASALPAFANTTSPSHLAAALTRVGGLQRDAVAAAGRLYRDGHPHRRLPMPQAVAAADGYCAATADLGHAVTILSGALEAAHHLNHPTAQEISGEHQQLRARVEDALTATRAHLSHASTALSEGADRSAGTTPAASAQRAPERAAPPLVPVEDTSRMLRLAHGVDGVHKHLLAAEGTSRGIHLYCALDELGQLFKPLGEAVFYPIETERTEPTAGRRHAVATLGRAAESAGQAMRAIGEAYRHSGGWNHVQPVQNIDEQAVADPVAFGEGAVDQHVLRFCVA